MWWLPLLFDNFVVVFALAVGDVLIGEYFACQVVVIENFDHDARKDHDYSDPLHIGDMMSIPRDVQADSEAFPRPWNKRIDVLSKNRN